MNRFLSTFFIVVFSFASVLLYGQNKNQKKDPAGWKKADKLYQQKGYMASATKYQMKHSAKDMKPDVIARIANSYRLNGDPELAEYWYSKCIYNNKNAEDVLHYAEVLQSNGKCEDAIRWFQEYQNMSESNREFISDCSELNAFEKRENVEVENLKALNTKYLDYSAVNFDDGVMFTSTRGIKKMRKMTDNWTKSNFSDVFFAKKTEEGTYESVTPIPGTINKKYHDGVTSVSESGTILYFSRNNKKRKRKGMINLKIFSSIFVDGKWTDATELPFNSDDYVSCHPSISADGKWIYFSSNRPGGFGGMDIYVSENVDGVWQTPINLGPTVNSSGNEVFPFINIDGALFFASNGHKGLGGLDIFYAEKTSLYDESTWDLRKNIGTPFNTKKDDFGFFTNREMNEGFLTSNRFGGKGGDDIYSWKTKDKKKLKLDETKVTTLQVLAAEGKTEIRNAKVNIKNISKNITSFDGKTNAKGIVETNVTDGETYMVTLEKEGYQTLEKEVSASEFLKGDMKFDLEKIKCIELFGTVLNEKYNNSIPNVAVTLLNKCTGERTVVNSQTDGAFDFCLDVGCDFEIVAVKENFMETETMVSTLEKPTSWESKEIKIEMLPVEKTKTTTPVATTTTPTTSTKVETKEDVKKHFLGDEKATFHVGQVLTLKNIYYDFNQSEIRPDAQMELNYIATMMNQFPNMQITLSSHTDSRGDNDYNKTLSDKRAKSAREYIISKGIPAHRIVAVGYGESVLKNDCKDGVDCSMDKHQINRRTEILINKMD